MNALETAISIALEAHAGQVDKSGAPYILHPLRLMLAMDNDIERMAAVLHDVLEDGPGWTEEKLLERGIPLEVVEIVRHLTKTESELSDYMQFIRRVSTHPGARRVKLADLEDNMNLSRIAQPSAKDHARVAKYREAHAFLRRF